MSGKFSLEWDPAFGVPVLEGIEPLEPEAALEVYQCINWLAGVSMVDTETADELFRAGYLSRLKLPPHGGDIVALREHARFLVAVAAGLLGVTPPAPQPPIDETKIRY